MEHSEGGAISNRRRADAEEGTQPDVYDAGDGDGDGGSDGDDAVMLMSYLDNDDDDDNDTDD